MTTYTARPSNSPAARSYQPIVWLAAIGFFMQSLDTTIVNTALPGMALSLGESPLHMHAVVVAYVLTMAAMIPASGWIADRFGLRRTFLSAIIMFSTASLLCALSQNLNQLVIARVFQGMGGAMLMPVGRLALLKIVPRERFLAALSFMTIPGLVGPLIGPAVGGWLVQTATWHWIFLINLPIGLAGVVLTLKVMPSLRNLSVPKFDLQGYVLLVTAMVCLCLSLTGLAEPHIAHISMLGLLALGIVAISAYWRHANHSSNALFRPDLFNTHSFKIGILANLFSRLGGSATPFLLPLMLQVGFNYSPAQTGLLMIPLVIGSLLVKQLISPIIEQFGYRNALITNTLLVGLGITSFALTNAHLPMWLHALHLIIFGMVNSLQFTAMNSLTLKDLDHQHASSGNSLLSMIMMLSMSMGVAAVSALLNGFSNLYGQPHILHAFQATFMCIGLITMSTACIFWQLPRAEVRSIRIEDE